MKKYDKYNATLIGKDRFIKEMIVKQPLPQIFVPLIKNVGCFLGEPLLLDRPVEKHRIFNLDTKKSWRNKLIYREI